MKFFLILLAISFMVADPSIAAEVKNISTGYNEDTSAKLAHLAPDADYTIGTGSAEGVDLTPFAITSGSVYSWFRDSVSTASTWIAIDIEHPSAVYGDSEALTDPGVYYFEVSVDLSGFFPASAQIVNLRYAADNVMTEMSIVKADASSIIVYSNADPDPNTEQHNWVTLGTRGNGAFGPGINTIRFKVQNMEFPPGVGNANPMGLRVEGTVTAQALGGSAGGIGDSVPTQVLYNKAGVKTGDSGLIYDDVANVLTVGSVVTDDVPGSNVIILNDNDSGIACNIAGGTNDIGLYADSLDGREGSLMVCNDAGVEKEIGFAKSIRNITLGETFIASDFRNGIITTTGTVAGTQVYTLPTPTVAGLGGNLCLMDTTDPSVNPIIELMPDITSTIRVQTPTLMDIKDGLQSTTQNATICIIAVDATTWMVWSKKGTWTRIDVP